MPPSPRSGPAVAFALVLLGLLGLAPGSATQLDAHYVRLGPSLVQRSSLTVGLALAGAPFSFRRDGELQGFEIDIARAAADAQGLDLELVELPPDRLAEALRAGEVDAIATLALPTGALPAGSLEPDREVVLLPYLLAGDHPMLSEGLLRTGEAGLALRADNEVVLHALRHSLATMVALGKYDGILRRYGLPAALSPYRSE